MELQHHHHHQQSALPSAVPSDKQHRYLNQQVQQLNDALSKLAIEKRNLHNVEQKLTEKLHSCIELIAGRHCTSKSNEKEKTNCGRKETETEKQTREIGTSSSSGKQSSAIDFSPESAIVNSNLFQENHLLDSLDSTVCLDFNVKSSEEELVYAEVIHCGTAVAAAIRDCWTLQQQSTALPLPSDIDRTSRQPRPLAITAANSTKTSCLSKRVQKPKYPEPELEDHRSIRKSLSRLLFKRSSGPKNRTTATTTISDSSNSSPESKQSNKFSSNSESSSFCSKQASTAAPISRSAIAWQLLERINSRERGGEAYEGESFDEDEEMAEEEEEGVVDIEEEEDVCSNSSLDCCASSPQPPAPFCSPHLPTAYRSNFILRENSDIYTTATTATHLCSGRQ